MLTGFLHRFHIPSSFLSFLRSRIVLLTLMRSLTLRGRRVKGLLENLFFQRKISRLLIKKNKWIKNLCFKNTVTVAPVPGECGHTSSGQRPSEHGQPAVRHIPVPQALPHTRWHSRHRWTPARNAHETVPTELCPSPPLGTCHGCKCRPRPEAFPEPPAWICLPQFTS